MRDTYCPFVRDPKTGQFVCKQCGKTRRERNLEGCERMEKTARDKAERGGYTREEKSRKKRSRDDAEERV